MRHFAALSSLFLLAACAGTSQPIVDALPTASVPVVRETTAVRTRDDAADDPAIWRHPGDPARSLIVSTDKKAGLYVYGLDGRTRSFTPAGRVNNVDLLADVKVAGHPAVLVAASDRSDERHAALALYTLTTEGRLAALARLPAGAGEAYGICLWQRAADRATFAFVVAKDGTIHQLQLDLAGATPLARPVRQLKLATQSEGCVVDARTAQLYVGEEDVGVWRFAADPSGAATPVLFAKADGRQLVVDVEGVALAPQGARGGYLLVSSQGDKAYAIYRLEDGTYAGRFRLVANTAGVDGTSGTDGIELMLGDFGPDFPGGLFVAQDGDNAPETQNFKLASWRSIAEALKLD
ncbi:phytase [Solimonas soli]|uniref:phytase n=1 Tax=Solimonas soli TaxID=413479 RepID=UPI000488E92E|nr:phytase [Solimonas soli]